MVISMPEVVERMLTEEQKKLVSDNHNLIYKYAHKHNLSVEDYYDLLAIGLCKAAQIYNPDKGELSTIAFVYMRYELFAYWNKLKKEIPVNMLFSYDVCISDVSGDFEGDKDFINSICDDTPQIDMLISQYTVDTFILSLTDKEQFILKALLKGLYQEKIAETLNCTQQNVSYYINKIKKKWLSFDKK